MVSPLKSHNGLTSVSIDLDTGATIECFLYTSTSEREVQEVLNDERSFLPIQCNGKIRFLNKRNVLLVTPTSSR